MLNIFYGKQRKVRGVGLFLFFSPPNPRITGGFSLLKVAPSHCIGNFSGYLLKFKFRQFPSDEIINVPVLLDAILLQNLPYYCKDKMYVQARPCSTQNLQFFDAIAKR